MGNKIVARIERSSIREGYFIPDIAWRYPDYISPCSTIWNSMPNAIIPTAAAAIGSRISSAASAARRRPRSASNSPRAHCWNDSAPSVLLSAPLPASTGLSARRTRENKLQRHHDNNEPGHDKENVIGFAAANETPRPSAIHSASPIRTV